MLSSLLLLAIAHCIAKPMFAVDIMDAQRICCLALPHILHILSASTAAIMIIVMGLSLAALS